MALFHLRKGECLTPQELEFVAEDESVTIVPSVSLPVMHFLGSDVGPLRPNVRASVPLWFAVTLRRRNKCRIEIPSWLANVRELEEVLRLEREVPDFFQPVAPHFVEIAQALFRHARDDFGGARKYHTARSLFEELRLVRESKIHSGIGALSDLSTLDVDSRERGTFTIPVSSRL